MSDVEVHIVRQGESLESIAAQRHLDWRDVWQHPENAKLRELRKSPHVIYPGDMLVVPTLQTRKVSIVTNKRHPFQVKLAPPSKLRVHFLTGDKPRANERYTLFLDDGSSHEGVTDSDGWLDEKIKVERQGAVVVFPSKNQTGAPITLAPWPRRKALQLPKGDTYVFDLKHLDPSTTVSGAKDRLHALGYGVGPMPDELDERTREALRSFQRAEGLNPTGELDSATQQQLSKKIEG